MQLTHIKSRNHGMSLNRLCWSSSSSSSQQQLQRSQARQRSLFQNCCQFGPWPNRAPRTAALAKASAVLAKVPALELEAASLRKEKQENAKKLRAARRQKKRVAKVLKTHTSVELGNLAAAAAACEQALSEALAGGEGEERGEEGEEADEEEQEEEEVEEDGDDNMDGQGGGSAGGGAGAGNGCGAIAVM